jgi:large subunit ribosomal protein L22
MVRQKAKGKRLEAGTGRGRTSKSKTALRARSKKDRQVKKDLVPKVIETQEEVIQKEAHAVGRYLKISPTKVQGVLDLIRGQPVVEALRVLRFSPRKGARLALKVLNSAVASAKNKGQFDGEMWVVSDARADKGPFFRKKRDPKAKGQWGIITTPSTHLKIVINRRSVTDSQKKDERTEAAHTDKSMEKTKPRRRVGGRGRREVKNGS